MIFFLDAFIGLIFLYLPKLALCMFLYGSIRMLETFAV